MDYGNGMPMNWEALGAIGELVGAAVVGITVIYLARQVRLGNQISKAEAWRSFVGKLVDINASQASDPVFRRAAARALQGATRDDLEEDERMAIGLWYASQLVVTEQAHREVLLGILPEEVLDNSLSNVFFKVPYFESVWPVVRPGRSEAFASWIDQRYGFERVTPGQP
jgi:hypothetical protein